MRNELERAGTIWNDLEPPGMSLNNLEQARTTWNEMVSATNWQKKNLRRVLCVQHNCLTEYITNSTSHKDLLLRC